MAVMGMTAEVPGWTPPKATEAPEKLRAALFYLARDLVPIGYIEHAVARAHSLAEEPPYATYPELAEMSDRWARELAYKPDVQPDGSSG
jgi:hypothetical protein